MSLENMLDSAKKSDWLVKSFTHQEFKHRKQLSIIASRIQLRRIEKGMNQKEFAKMMGVTQGMISKWESGEYNFSIDTLSQICEGLELEFTPYIREKDYKNTQEYKPVELRLIVGLKNYYNFNNDALTEGLA